MLGGIAFSGPSQSSSLHSHSSEKLNEVRGSASKEVQIMTLLFCNLSYHIDLSVELLMMYRWFPPEKMIHREAMCPNGKIFYSCILEVTYYPFVCLLVRQTNFGIMWVGTTQGCEYHYMGPYWGLPWRLDTTLFSFSSSAQVLPIVALN